MFLKTIGFYLNELTFDSSKIIDGIEDEITAVKHEGEQLDILKLDEIRCLMERISLSEKQYF